MIVKNLNTIITEYVVLFLKRLLSLPIMRLLWHFLALFSYLNIMCYEVKYGCVLDLTPIESNETLIEVVLEEVLDLTHAADIPENIPEIIFDEYRILLISIALVAAIFIMTWLVNNILLRYRLLKHPIYFSKTICLPGYYSFLSRYRLF